METWKTSVRVATAQGKQGIWMFIFPDGKNTGDMHEILRYVFTQGIYLQDGNFEVLKTEGIPRLCKICVEDKCDNRINVILKPIKIHGKG